MSDMISMPSWRRFRVVLDTVYDGVNEEHALSRLGFDILRRAGNLSGKVLDEEILIEEISK